MNKLVAHTDLARASSSWSYLFSSPPSLFRISPHRNSCSAGGRESSSSMIYWPQRWGDNFLRLWWWILHNWRDFTSNLICAKSTFFSIYFSSFFTANNLSLMAFLVCKAKVRRGAAHILRTCSIELKHHEHREITWKQTHMLCL